MPFIEANDRTSLYYKAWGRGKPVVFVSSWALGGDMWEYQMLPLSDQGMRCITYDRRGHNRSDDPGHGYDFDTLADDLAVLIEQLDLHDVTLVGHSMGCAEIVRYLTRHGSGRISRAALVSTITPGSDQSGGVPETVIESTISLMTTDRARYFSSGVIKFFGLGAKWPQVSTEISPELAQWGYHLIMQSSPKAITECWRVMRKTNFLPELATLTVPILVIHGDRDQNAPLDACGQRTAQAIPGSQLVIYEGAPHGLFFTDRDRLARDIGEFVQG